MHRKIEVMASECRGRADMCGVPAPSLELTSSSGPAALYLCIFVYFSAPTAKHFCPESGVDLLILI